jgi:hypothetical protein
MSPSSHWSSIGTVAWVNDAAAGIGNAKPRPDSDYGSVYALKADYRCPNPRCTRPYTVLHVTLLRHWLDAVVLGEDHVDLGQLPGTFQPSKPRVGRIPDRGTARAYSTRKAR